MLMTMKYMIVTLNRKLRVKLMKTYTTGPVPPALNWVMKFLSKKTRLTKVVSKTGNSLVVESNREPVLQKHKSCEAIH